jgi:hypothetical protein
MYRVFIVLCLLIISALAGSFFQKVRFRPRHPPLSSSPIPSQVRPLSLSPPLEFELLPVYPWEGSKGKGGKISLITKDYFRCKGSCLNQPLPIMKEGKVVENIFDCNGADSHSLLIRHEQEFVYPILIELLNEIQASTGKPVIITSGHRCPTHNHYIDPSPQNQTSKHQIGAEVAFYVAGLENTPDPVLNAIFAFYKSNPRYAKEEAYTKFERFEKETDASTKPWFNKEIMIKLYKAAEGRNGDNKHPFPYFSIQVRFDKDTNMRVTYSWKESQQYHRK